MSHRRMLRRLYVTYNAGRSTARHQGCCRGNRGRSVRRQLVVYKKGLYLAGYSHHHESVRTFSLDGFREIDRLKKDHFEYPKEYHPSQLVEGAFGMIGGERTRVRLLFDAKVGRFVRRRLWHPTQEIRKTDRGVEMVMEVAGTTELKTWVLGWGDKVEVLEPTSLREEVISEAERTLARYGKLVTSPKGSA